MTRQIRLIAFTLAALTLCSSTILVVWDIHPQLFPPHAHDYLSSFSLGIIAIAWLVWQIGRKGSGFNLLRAVLLAAAFLLWAANQFWPGVPRATLYNDLAVALFVIDVFLSINSGAGGSLTVDETDRQSKEQRPAGINGHAD